MLPGERDAANCKFIGNHPDGQGDGEGSGRTGRIWTSWIASSWRIGDRRGQPSGLPTTVRSWFRNCVFARNESTSWAPVISATSGGHDVTLQGCTLVENVGGGSTIRIRGDLVLDRTIIHGSVNAVPR